MNRWLLSQSAQVRVICPETITSDRSVSSSNVSLGTLVALAVTANRKPETRSTPPDKKCLIKFFVFELSHKGRGNHISRLKTRQFCQSLRRPFTLVMREVMYGKVSAWS